MDRQPTRRRLLQTGGAAALSVSCAAPAPEPQPPQPRIPLGVSTYSYWHFSEEKYPIEKVIDHAAKLGFDGVEILHRQMENESADYMNGLKRRAWEAGLDLIMLSIHQDFVDPSETERQEAIDHTKHCIDLAHQMGIPAIRLNTGRWGTIRSFDDLMAANGQEPALDGYTDEDAIGWCVDSIRKCLPHAAQAGVVMALENHWGLSTSVDVLLRIHQEVGDPWLGINMDTGNYVGDPYPQIEKLAPHASIIQAKTYPGGGVWYTLDLDYPRIAGIVRDAGFQGYVSLEMEGNAPAEQAVAESYQVLRDAFG
ncbi:MAG: sugar phosphate isomerase/epimerase [Bryobacterales bacterium]|nr:sugar phosphate isomerase/epimerase [Bryobacterales bacterium]